MMVLTSSLRWCLVFITFWSTIPKPSYPIPRIWKFFTPWLVGCSCPTPEKTLNRMQPRLGLVYGELSDLIFDSRYLSQLTPIKWFCLTLWRVPQRPPNPSPNEIKAMFLCVNQRRSIFTHLPSTKFQTVFTSYSLIFFSFKNFGSRNPTHFSNFWAPHFLMLVPICSWASQRSKNRYGQVFNYAIQLKL